MNFSPHRSKRRPNAHRDAAMNLDAPESTEGKDVSEMTSSGA